MPGEDRGTTMPTPGTSMESKETQHPELTVRSSSLVHELTSLPVVGTLGSFYTRLRDSHWALKNSLMMVEDACSTVLGKLHIGSTAAIKIDKAAGDGVTRLKQRYPSITASPDEMLETGKSNATFFFHKTIRKIFRTYPGQITLNVFDWSVDKADKLLRKVNPPVRSPRKRKVIRAVAKKMQNEAADASDDSGTCNTIEKREHRPAETVETSRWEPIPLMLMNKVFRRVLVTPMDNTVSALKRVRKYLHAVSQKRKKPERPGIHSPEKEAEIEARRKGASAALAAARRTVAKAGSSFRRRGRETRHRTYYQQESSSDQFSDSDQSFVPGDQSRVVQGREIDGASANSSPTASTVYSPQSNVVSSTPKPVLNLAGGVDSKSNKQVSCKDSDAELEDSMFNPRQEKPIEKMQYDDSMAEYLELAEAMNVIKKKLAMLQDLLLSGLPPDGEETGTSDVIEGATPADQIVILRSQLQQSHKVCSDLREELSSCKLENMQFQGVKAGLQQRLSEQETLVSELKSNLLHKDFQLQNFDSEKANIIKQIQDRDKLITALRSRDSGIGDMDRFERTTSDTNKAVQPRKRARSFKFHIEKEMTLYYKLSKNKKC